MGNKSSKQYYCTVCGFMDPSPVCIKCHNEREGRRRREESARYEKEKADREERHRESQRNYQLKLEKLAEAAKEAERANAAAIKKNAIENIDSAINECNQELTKIETESKSRDENIVSVKKDLEDATGELTESDEKLNDKKQSEEKLMADKAVDLGLAAKKQKFEHCNDTIKQGIKDTCVGEEDIHRFLTLLDYLTTATLSNQAANDNLVSTMNVFAQLIERDASGDITIDSYFGKKANRLVALLHNEDFDNMEDLVCDDDDEYEEMKELVLNQLKLENEKWEKLTQEEKEANGQLEAPKTELTGKEKKVLKSACTKPDSWKKLGAEKTDLLKKRLTASSPLYCLFFKRIYEAVETAQAMLTYNEVLNEKQRKAIAMAKNKDKDKNKHKERLAIGMAPAEDNKEEKKDNSDNKNDNDNNNDNNNDDDDGSDNTGEQLNWVMEALNDESKVKVANTLALREIAIDSIHVVESLNNELSNVAEGGENTENVVKTIESTCMKVITAQGNIRQAVFLAQEIHKFKPAKLEGKAQDLWNAIDESVSSIFERALLLNKTSMEYFGYFIKFQQSFQYYLNGQDKSLVVSTEYIQKDVKDFTKFSVEFEKEIEKINSAAMDCIKKCIKNKMGAQAWDEARNGLEKARKDYLTAEKMLNEYEAELLSEYYEELNRNSKLESRINQDKLKLDLLEKEKEFAKQRKDQVNTTKTQLLQTKAKIAQK